MTSRRATRRRRELQRRAPTRAALARPGSLVAGTIGAGGAGAIGGTVVGAFSDREGEIGERSARTILNQLDAKARTSHLTMEEEQARQALRRRFESKSPVPRA